MVLHFSPESYENRWWQVFWLTLFYEVFPSRQSGTVTKRGLKLLKELTAAGTVPEFHRIPFSHGLTLVWP
jgi:hypothetical protein